MMLHNIDIEIYMMLCMITDAPMHNFQLLSSEIVESPPNRLDFFTLYGCESIGSVLSLW